MRQRDLTECGYCPESMLVVAGHAIYQDGRWRGVPVAGIESTLEEHVTRGCELAAEKAYSAIMFSGGHTRPGVPGVTNTEADGMLEFLCSTTHFPPAVLRETFARDGFENVFFSLLSYRAHRSCWPSRVGVVSWPFKKERFILIADSLGIGNRFEFFGVGPEHDVLASREKSLLDAARNDSFHRGPPFDAMRQSRTQTPEDYANSAPVAYTDDKDSLDAVTRVHQNVRVGSRWPWSS